MNQEITPHDRPVRSALKKANLSGSFVVGKYRFSPYMACEHGCAYCDGRAERYFVEGDFARDIIVRPNVPVLLDKELPKLREKGFITVSSGITDAYQPLEAKIKLTRRCAEVLTRYNSPVTIMTKSSLALRDIDLWSRIDAGCIFIVSLTFADDAKRRIFEPGASPVEERIEALKAFKAAGCYTGILAMPLLPSISDTDENLDPLFTEAKEAGVDFIMPAGLTLRPGRQKAHFLKILKEGYPNLVGLYTSLYGENRESGMVVSDYDRRLRKRCAEFNRKYDLPFLVPHYVFRNRLHAYDELNVLFHHMIELYDARGTDTRRLKAGMRRYLEWLEARKKEYNRKPSMSYRKLDWELRGLVDSGQAETVTGNERLGEFMRDIVLGRKLFDYVDLKLKDGSDGPPVS